MTILWGHPKRTAIVIGLISISAGYYYRFSDYGGLFTVAGILIIGLVIIYGMTALCDPDWFPSNRRRQ